MKIQKLLGAVALVPLVLIMASCNGDHTLALPGSGLLPPPPPPPPPPPLSSVNISGAITFDSVAHNAATSGLDYNNITQKPARGIIVEAVDGSGAVLATVMTDENGQYTVGLDSNTDVRIQAKAKMLQTTGAQWDIATTDNTNGNALYVLVGSLTSTGTADSVRDLNAASGWGGTRYTGTRAAAPFAILSPIYDALQKFSVVDSDVVLPPVEFRWSVNNRPASGDLTQGEINISSYIKSEGGGNVYILGAVDSDTDEYDFHVIIHEWGHYFEDRISRADSIGGSHGDGDLIDPRVAMGEGFGNALSGIISGDPLYRDSSGPGQADGFMIDLDENAIVNPGWFSEGSVQSVLYDLFDSEDDGADTVSMGVGPLYNVFTAPAYTGQSVFTTIFSFIDRLEMDNPDSAAQIRSLLAAQSIIGTGPTGAGETNDGGVPTSLPVYNSVTLNGAAVQICSVDDAGTQNKLGVHQYLTFTAPTAGSYTFTMSRTSGDADRNPDFTVFEGKTVKLLAESGDNNVETGTVELSAGDHVIDALDYLNDDTAEAGDSCYDFTVTQP